ncbi:PAS domain-containing sensor histidine kinase [Oceanibacterium hippocampi]|nr:PAS domain-containing sensor histidine kinase [Oceanibacterium hippocampi]
MAGGLTFAGVGASLAADGTGAAWDGNIMLLALALAIALALALAVLWWRERTKAAEAQVAAKAAEDTLRGQLAEQGEELARIRLRVSGLEEMLRHSEHERDAFEALLEAAPIPIWQRDADLEIAWRNAAYRHIVEGNKPDGAPAELVSALDPEQARRLARRALDAGQEQRESRYFVVDGDRHAFEITERPVRRDETVLAGFAIDFTALDEVRAELNRHIDAHAEVLENLRTAIAIYGADQRLEFYNKSYARLWRFDEAFLDERPTFGEVLERQREERRLPEQVDFQAYKAKRRQLFTSVLQPMEELVQLPDETMLRTVITPHPFGGLLFLFEDVTDKLVLERARNTLIAVQRATLDNLYEGVAVFGADGCLKLSNAAFRRLWDLPEEFLAGEPHIAQIFDEYLARTALSGNDELRSRVIASATDRNANSGRMRASGDIVLDYASVPLPDGNVLFIYFDVTDSLRIEHALRERNEALEAADRMKSEFVANVSHELRTPLNSIIGFAEIMVNRYFGELNPRQIEYAQGILDSSNHLLLLINDILDLALIEAGRMSLEPAPVDLHAMLAGLLTLIRERARNRNLKLEFDCPPDIGWVELDERRIKQVIFNLLGNSLKFTPSGGRITLRAEEREGEVAIVVADTGIGIPESEQASVFDKFNVGRGVRQTGAGLGLALVRSFVELHGGRIDLVSSPADGTRITCILPLTRADAPPSEDSDASLRSASA